MNFIRTECGESLKEFQNAHHPATGHRAALIEVKTFDSKGKFRNQKTNLREIIFLHNDQWS